MAPRSSLPQSSKKRKSDSDAHSSSDVASRIQSLEQQIVAAVSSKSSLNPLADLLDLARSTSDPQTLSKAIYALYRVFVVIITNGLLLSVSGSDETRAVRSWIQDRLHGYVELLTGLLKDEESILRVSFPSEVLYRDLLGLGFISQNSSLSPKTSLDLIEPSTWV